MKNRAACKLGREGEGLPTAADWHTAAPIPGCVLGRGFPVEWRAVVARVDDTCPPGTPWTQAPMALAQA
jgi:hypothetical protein